MSAQDAPKVTEIVYMYSEWNAGGPDPEVGRPVHVTFLRPAGRGGEPLAQQIWQDLIDADIFAGLVEVCEGESESLREEWRLIRASDYPEVPLGKVVCETWAEAHAAEEDVRRALGAAGWTVRRLGQRS